jgi:hypothetical protein
MAPLEKMMTDKEAGDYGMSADQMSSAIGSPLERAYTTRRPSETFALLSWTGDSAKEDPIALCLITETRSRELLDVYVHLWL